MTTRPRTTAIEPIPGTDRARLFLDGQPVGEFSHAEADRRAADHMDRGNRIIVAPNAEGGWTVTLRKVAGMNKGETVLATLCGGMMGQRLAELVARTAAEQMMIDIELKG